MTYILLICLLLLASCGKPYPQVNHIGALKNFRNGDITAKVNLQQLQKYTSLYGLGAMGNLKGEIIVWDSQPFFSNLMGPGVQTQNKFDVDASLFVYTQVKNWNEESLSNIANIQALEMHLNRYAAEHNIETAIPFLLTGKVNELLYHIIDWDESRKDHSPKAHRESGKVGTMFQQEVNIVGFYSSTAKAIYTHHDSNLHLHVLTADRLMVAHVDNLAFDRMQLSLPE